MPRQAFLIERLDLNELENDIRAAVRWTAVGIALEQTAAGRAVAEGGIHKGSSWPPVAYGTPLVRAVALPVVDAEDEHARRL